MNSFLPEDGLPQTLCTDSWGLSSSQSDHMEEPCRQTLFQSPLPHEQSDKLSPGEAASAVNCIRVWQRVNEFSEIFS